MKLGALKKVDLRKIWYHEAHDFTKWLAKEENISKLTEELDIDIENIIPEASSGRYNVDILANEVHTGKKVIIENQLEVTDHKHLGQILTYASGHDASIIIWLVKDYREEHKQSIDWFNVNMAEAISFFLVKIESSKSLCCNECKDHLLMSESSMPHQPKNLRQFLLMFLPNLNPHLKLQLKQ
mgnify:CR=1 FL=1